MFGARQSKCARPLFAHFSLCFFSVQTIFLAFSPFSCLFLAAKLINYTQTHSQLGLFSAANTHREILLLLVNKKQTNSNLAKSSALVQVELKKRLIEIKQVDTRVQFVTERAWLCPLDGCFLSCQLRKIAGQLDLNNNKLDQDFAVAKAINFTTKRIVTTWSSSSSNKNHSIEWI